MHNRNCRLIRLRDSQKIRLRSPALPAGHPAGTATSRRSRQSGRALRRRGVVVRCRPRPTRRTLPLPPDELPRRLRPRKGRKSVADGETEVRLPATASTVALESCSAVRSATRLRMRERFLVAGEPVEHALAYDRHHDLDRVGLPDMRAQYVIRMLDRADDEDVPAHGRNRTARRAPGGLAAEAAAFSFPPARPRCRGFAPSVGRSECSLFALDEARLSCLPA
jgi:hypothetical protein